MTRWTVVLVLCALAGCKVSTEGAPCQTDASCPGGQRCGANLRCSVQAAKCTECADGETACVDGGLATCTVASDGICRVFGDPVAPGSHQVCDDSTPGAARLACVTTDCAAAGTACPGGATWLTCEVDGDGCLFASASSPCANGLVCGAAADSCVCAAASGTYYADPVAGSDTAASPAPTGAGAPPGCRFRAIGPAVQAANARVLSGGGAAATVLVTATGGTAPFTFSEPALELQPGVALTSDAPTSPAGPPASFPYVLELSGAPGVKLHEGATLSGLQIQPAADGTVTDAVVTACASGATQAAVVRDARVLGTNPSGGPRFESGVHQTGACPLTVERTLLEGNGKGVLVEADAATTVRVDACEVRGSRDVGIYFSEVPPAVDVHVTNTSVHQNCATIDAFVPGGTRRGGGVLFTTQLPTLEFRGNRVADNQGDQVLVASTGDFPAFTLTGDGTASGGSCPAPQDANRFTCRDASGSYVAVYSSGASVQALGNFWKNVPPISGQDYSGPVQPRDPIDSGGQFCGQDTSCDGTPASCP